MALSLPGQALVCRERGDISCIISCSSKRCRCDLVRDRPSCLSLPLPGAVIRGSIWCSLYLPFTFYLFSSFFIFSSPPAVTFWQQRRLLVGWLGHICSPFSPGDTPNAASTLIFWPHGQEGVFSVALGLHFQKAFTLSVCAARLTKTPTAFFQPEVLVLASLAALCPPSSPSPTPRLFTVTPNTSFSRQFQGWGGGREIESNTTNWTFWRTVGRWEAGECKWALHYHRPLELSCMFSGFLKALIWPKSSFL